MSIIILLFGRPFSEYVGELSFYITTIILVFLIVKLFHNRQAITFRFFRLLYPVFLFSFFYSMMDGLVFIFFDNFLDYQLTAFEKSIFGTNPTIWIDQNALSTWANEFFSFSYFTYYFMIIGFFIPVFFLKNEYALKKTLTAVCITFFVSYTLFMLYPIEGPRWYFATEYINEIESPLFRHFVNYVIDNGAFRGGCMPSSHVAVALIILFSCFIYYPKVGLILLPINIGLAIGTFWGRFHYVTDVFVGIFIAVAVHYIVNKYYDKWDSREYKENGKALDKQYAS